MITKSEIGIKSGTYFTTDFIKGEIKLAKYKIDCKLERNEKIDLDAIKEKIRHKDMNTNCQRLYKEFLAWAKWRLNGKADKKEKGTSVLSFGVDYNFLLTLKTEAKNAKISQSEYVREAIREKFIKDGVTL